MIVHRASNGEGRHRVLWATAIAAILWAQCPLDRANSQVASSQRDGGKQLPVFETATVRPTPKDNNIWRLQFNLDGFSARGVAVRQVIQEAYGVYEQDRMSQGQQWLTSDRFDIEAKVGLDDAANFGKLGLDERRSILQRLLEDRFGLKVHHESKELPVFSLVVSSKGSKLRPANAGDSDPGQTKNLDGLVTRSGAGILEIEGISMKGFSAMLSRIVGRVVIDQTHLPGSYNLALKWSPEQAHPLISDAAGTAPKLPLGSDLSGPSIFEALQDQVGLRLKSTKSSVDTIVIDQVERPSPN